MATWNPVDSDDEFEDKEFRRSGKTALIAIISAAPEMFQPMDWESGGEKTPTTPFKIALKCCESLWRNKVVSNDKGMVSILLCGTEQFKNCSDFEHLYVLQEMSTVKVGMIEELDSLRTSDDWSGFEENIGSSNQYDLKDVFWLTKTMFEDARSDAYLKKVLFFTCDDSPHASNPNLQKDAIEKYKDLGRVDFNVIAFNENFQFDKFYSSVFEDNSSIIVAKDADSLMKVIKMKQAIRRPVVRSTLEIAPGYKIAVGVYNFISKRVPPSAVKINKMTSEQLEKNVSKFRKDTGMPVLKSEERKVVEIKGVKAVFEENELKKLNYGHETGLTLLGFMNESELDFMNSFRAHSYFIYPDEERITGSREFFTSLLKRCHALEKIALVKWVFARGRKPKLACLIPSLVNEEGSSIPFPQGFHVFMLPYSDEIRKAAVPNNPECPPTVVDVMEKVVKKLTNRKFDLSSYQNPAIQFKWRHLEKLALETLEQDDYYDYTDPDFEMMDGRLGNLPRELEMEVADASPSVASVFAAQASAKPTAQVNMLMEYKNKRVEKQTVESLKNFLESKGVKTGPRPRKADVVAQVYEYFDNQPS